MITGCLLPSIMRTASSTADLRASLSLSRLFLKSQMRIKCPAAHAVARKLEIDGPLEAVGRGEAAVDLAKRRQRIVEQGGSDRDFLEDLPLRVEIADAVVQQRIRTALIDCPERR